MGASSRSPGAIRRTRAITALGAIFAWALQCVQREVHMQSRSSSVARSQRPPSASDGESRSRRGGLTARNDPGRTIVHPPTAVTSRASPLIPASLRDDMIREAAYFRAQARGFVPGKEIEDWLAAEQDIEELIRRRYGRAYLREGDRSLEGRIDSPPRGRGKLGTRQAQTAVPLRSGSR